MSKVFTMTAERNDDGEINVKVEFHQKTNTIDSITALGDAVRGSIQVAGKLGDACGLSNDQVFDLMGLVDNEEGDDQDA